MPRRCLTFLSQREATGEPARIEIEAGAADQRGGAPERVLALASEAPQLGQVCTPLTPAPLDAADGLERDQRTGSLQVALGQHRQRAVEVAGGERQLVAHPGSVGGL